MGSNWSMDTLRIRPEVSRLVECPTAVPDLEVETYRLGFNVMGWFSKDGRKLVQRQLYI